MGHWLLLEQTDHLLPELYRLGEDPDPIRLFDGTELEACEEESPLLIDAIANPALLAAAQRQPHLWPGLLLQTTRSTDELLAHLRHILFIRFEQERRGVLRYTSPRTASYLFPACTSKTLPIWLGPIETVSWHGGTWRESAERRETCQRLENPGAKQWRALAAKSEPHLDPHQEQALQHQQGEHFLFQWWKRQTGIRFETAWSYLTEGMDAGFASAESLTTYLDLRHLNPHAASPHALPVGTDQERLDALAQHLAKSTTDKECTP